MSDLIENARQAAKEIANEGHSGWGNTIIDLISALEAKDKEIERLREVADDISLQHLKYIEQLEAALREIIDYHDIGGEHVITCQRIAKRALGERDEQ